MYAQLPTSTLFVPIAIETIGAFGEAEEAAKFMSELGRRLTRTTQDSLSASFLCDYAERQCCLCLWDD